MDIATYFGIAVGLVLALLFWKVDDFFDRVLGWFLNPLFSLIGLDSAGGPFASQARELDDCIELVIQKAGSGKAAPAAIFVMFDLGWKASASKNSRCKAFANLDPIVVLPDPVTPIMM